MNEITIGNITLHLYGLMIAIGLFVGYLIAERRAEKKGLDSDKLLNLFFVCMAGCIIGGKLVYCMVEFDEFIKNPIMLFDINGGFVIYGSLIFGFYFGYRYCKYDGINFLKYFEMFIPSLAFAQGIGRIGCFFAGCCYGKETNAWYGFTYTDSLIAPNGVSLIPTQLIMSAADLLLAAILFYVSNKKPKEGIQLSLYLILYSIGRFFIEFLRNDDRGMLLGMSTSQIIAIFTLVFGVYLFVKVKKKDIMSA